jgi:hypothetical protein
MPKQKDVRLILQKQIEDLTTKLKESRAGLISYQVQVRQQETELSKLTNALKSLDGIPILAIGLPDQPLRDESRDPMHMFPASKIQTATINGEEIIVEPGFHVEKNSFGEDCIIPDGVKYAPAPEPVATPDTRAGLVPLPAITSGEGFDDPADIINAELPNA